MGISIMYTDSWMIYSLRNSDRTGFWGFKEIRYQCQELLNSFPMKDHPLFTQGFASAGRAR